MVRVGFSMMGIRVQALPPLPNFSHVLVSAHPPYPLLHDPVPAGTVGDKSPLKDIGPQKVVGCLPS